MHVPSAFMHLLCEEVSSTVPFIECDYPKLEKSRADCRIANPVICMSLTSNKRALGGFV